MVKPSHQQNRRALWLPSENSSSELKSLLALPRPGLLPLTSSVPFEGGFPMDSLAEEFARLKYA